MYTYLLEQCQVKIRTTVEVGQIVNCACQAARHCKAPAGSCVLDEDTDDGLIVLATACSSVLVEQAMRPTEESAAFATCDAIALIQRRSRQAGAYQSQRPQLAAASRYTGFSCGARRTVRDPPFYVDILHGPAACQARSADFFHAASPHRRRALCQFSAVTPTAPWKSGGRRRAA